MKTYCGLLIGAVCMLIPIVMSISLTVADVTPALWWLLMLYFFGMAVFFVCLTLRVMPYG